MQHFQVPISNPQVLTLETGTNYSKEAILEAKDKHLADMEKWNERYPQLQQELYEFSEELKLLGYRISWHSPNKERVHELRAVKGSELFDIAIYYPIGFQVSRTIAFPSDSGENELLANTIEEVRNYLIAPPLAQ
jgi:hypothetical protein